MSKSLTINGHLVDLTNPTPDQIHIEDILYSLCHMPRYNSHSNPIWTVGQHTLALCDYLEHLSAPFAVKQVALIHDFPEYVLCDIPAPLKPYLGVQYAKLTETWEDAICKRFDCGSGDTFRRIYGQNVKRYDKMMSWAEMDLFTQHDIGKDVDEAMKQTVLEIMDVDPTDVMHMLDHYVDELLVK